jgi:hypothetical protein
MGGGGCLYLMVAQGQTTNKTRVNNPFKPGNFGYTWTVRLHSSSVGGQIRRCSLNETSSTVPWRHWDVESHGWSPKKHQTSSSWIVPVNISQPARVIKGTFDLYVSFIPNSNQRAFWFELLEFSMRSLAETVSADLPNRFLTPTNAS